MFAFWRAKHALCNVNALPGYVCNCYLGHQVGNQPTTALAFDLGATSGRAILGTLLNGQLSIQEIHRFRNHPVETPRGLRWNTRALREAMEEGLCKAGEHTARLDSIGVDTWGVDYALLDQNGRLLGEPYAYRDPRTDGVMDPLVNKIGKQRLYQATGIQFMQINTLYQLHATTLQEPALIADAALFLTMPDLLNYWLTGVAACEYTNATTTQMLDCRKRCWSSIIEDAGIPWQILPPIVPPGTVLGPLVEDFRKIGSHLETTRVIAPACHDTGSAVAAVRASVSTAFISSGTWSLLGTEFEEPIRTSEAMNLNFTNEGGVNGTVRLLKNITGMWLLEGCMRDWSKQGQTLTYADIVTAARGAGAFRCFIDPDNPRFLHPECMTAAITAYCDSTDQSVPQSPGEFARAILESLALKYRVVLCQLQSLTGTRFTDIRVIGGGSDNDLLNEFTANATGCRVIAGPKEATALGNLIVQFAGAGAIASIDRGRDLISQSFKPRVFLPQEDWSAAYTTFHNQICRP